jgi:hypothetical protein
MALCRFFACVGTSSFSSCSVDEFVEDLSNRVGIVGFGGNVRLQRINLGMHHRMMTATATMVPTHIIILSWVLRRYKKI